MLDFLVDVEGVEPGDIAVEIPKRGGIEAIYKVAARENPRRSKLKPGKQSAKSALKKPSMLQSKLQKMKDEDDDDDWTDDNTDVGNLETITVQLRRPQVSDILDSKKGQRMTWIVVRLGDDADHLAVAEIQEIRPI